MCITDYLLTFLVGCLTGISNLTCLRQSSLFLLYPVPQYTEPTYFHQGPHHTSRQLSWRFSSSHSHLHSHSSHISKSVSKSCHFFISTIPLISVPFFPLITTIIVQALIFSHLGYCNNFLIELPNLSLAPFSNSCQNDFPKIVLTMSTSLKTSSFIQ